ncbi:MAG: electron transfer flavoprotein subunit alpha/FixB family protein [Saprospiraceae bacterium]|nr:electron transfer flavoprotein subunit alpha/FixB family protein [Saprospiraceae bacterium]
MVLLFAEVQQGNFKKTTLEAATYAAKTAELLGVASVAIVLGEAENAAELGLYGIQKVYQVRHDHLKNFDNQVGAIVLSAAAHQLEASVIVLSHTSNGKALAGRLAARWNAASISGATGLPTLKDGVLHVRKGMFSGKAIAEYALKSEHKVITVMGNALQPLQHGALASVETLSLEVPSPKIKIKEVKRVEGIVPLPEAELVVSAGRGLKGPENWGIVEELASALGATTACSRPVADSHWRPHHEHVGQTGVAIRPNLYIAIGISGAIQHLAGVNNSKTIVVINKDADAPFFKAADYGIVGDLFEIVPKFTAAVKKLKA